MIIIGLASIPTRFESLKKTLLSLVNQTIKPDVIQLNICKVYNRFSDTWKDEEIQILSSYDRVVINWCMDEGPGTKTLGINKVKDDDKIIIVDDDMEYDRDTIKTLIESLPKDYNCVSSFNYFNEDNKYSEQSNGSMYNNKFIKPKLPGYLGYCFYGVHLLKLQTFMRSVSMKHPEVLYDDDATSTGYFRKNKFIIVWNSKLNFIPNEQHYEGLFTIEEYSKNRLTLIPYLIENYTA